MKLFEAKKCSEVNLWFEEFNPKVGGNVINGVELFPALSVKNKSPVWAENIVFYIENDRLKGIFDLCWGKDIELERFFNPILNCIRFVFDDRESKNEEFCFTKLTNIDMVDIEFKDENRLHIKCVMKGLTTHTNLFSLSRTQKIWFDKFGIEMKPQIEEKEDDGSHELKKKMAESIIINYGESLNQIYKFDSFDCPPELSQSYDLPQICFYKILEFGCKSDPKFIEVLRNFKVKYRG